jgi:hypothetical protein
VTPAQLLDRLDRAASEREAQARQFRTAADRLRVDLAEASALLGVTALDPAPEPPVKPPKPAAPQTAPAKSKARRIVYPEGMTRHDKTIHRLRHRGHPDLADQVEACELSLNKAEIAAGFRSPEASRSRKRRQRPIANGEGAQVTRRRPLRHPSPLDGDPSGSTLTLDSLAGPSR